MAPTVSAIIVSYNTNELLRRAIASVLESTAAVAVEVLVVDNASSDCSPAMVRREFPGVRLLSLTRNHGFAAGANLGLQVARGRQLLLLNPDAELLDDGLARLSSFMDETPWAAAVGPRLIYSDGTPQHSAFRFPGLGQILLDFFPLHGRLLDSALNGRYPPAEAPHPIDHPLGACMLIRREAVDDVGLLDDEFFMYCEEIDWCWRAWRHGWAVYHHPGAVAVHHGGKSTEQRRGAMYVQLHRSRLRLYRKHRGRLFRSAARALTALGLQAEIARAERLARRGQLPAAAAAERIEGCRSALALLRR